MQAVERICVTKGFYVTAMGFVGCILFFVFAGVEPGFEVRMILKWFASG